MRKKLSARLADVRSFHNDPPLPILAATATSCVGNKAPESNVYGMLDVWCNVSVGVQKDVSGYHSPRSTDRICSFPQPVQVKKDMNATFIVSQFDITAKDVLSLSDANFSDMFAIHSCRGASEVSVDNGLISFTAPYFVYQYVPVFTYNMTMLVASEEPTSVLLQLMCGIDVLRTFAVSAPAAQTEGLTFKYVYTSANTVEYKATYFSLSDTQRQVELKLLNVDDQVPVTFLTDCATISRTRYSFIVQMNTTVEKPLASGDVHLLFASSYDPDALHNKLSLAADNSAQRTIVPAVVISGRRLSASVFSNRVAFSFADMDTNTLMMSKIWGIRPKDANSIQVYAVTDNCQVGHIVASVDGRFWEVVLNSGVVTNVNGKFSLPVSYFDLIARYDYPLQGLQPSVQFEVGPYRLSILYAALPFSEKSTSSDTVVLVCDKPYELQFDITTAGNKGKVVIDFFESALKSAKKCMSLAKVGGVMESNPVTCISTDAQVVHFTLTEDNIKRGDDRDLTQVRGTLNI